MPNKSILSQTKTKNKSLSDMDKIYLQHQSTSLNQAQARTLPFLGNLITINLAYIGVFFWIPQTNQSSPLLPSDWKILLSILFIIFNISLSLIYFRELLINRILHKIFYFYFVDDCGPFSQSIRNAIMHHDKMPKWTGKIISFLFVFTAFLPVANILFLTLKWNGYALLSGLFVLAGLITCCIICKIDKLADVKELSTYLNSRVSNEKYKRSSSTLA